MVPSAVDDVVPFEDWPSAARSALAFLHRTVGLDVWMLTRVQGDQQIVLHAHPFEAVPVGTAMPWDQSFCRKMVSGTGPRVSTVTAATPAYAQPLNARAERVAAYVGVPLVDRDGTVFGTLCGVSARAQPRSLARNLPVVEMTARMLSTLIALVGPQLRATPAQPGE
ncbi:GAF domain-containing protein [Modestobacter lapidis]|nr:GAF domain-containing protein [Modestobacter lapidis]